MADAAARVRWLGLSRKENKVSDSVKRVYAFGNDASGKNVTEGNTYIDRKSTRLNSSH